MQAALNVGLTIAAPGGATAAPTLAAALAVEGAKQVLRSGARELRACAEQLEARRHDLLVAQAGVRWSSPAARAHQDLMRLDLRDLEETAAQCTVLAALLSSLAGAS